jgi:hypothetical protein
VEARDYHYPNNVSKHLTVPSLKISPLRAIPKVADCVNPQEAQPAAGFRGVDFVMPKVEMGIGVLCKQQPQTGNFDIGSALNKIPDVPLLHAVPSLPSLRNLLNT